MLEITLHNPIIYSCRSKCRNSLHMLQSIVTINQILTHFIRQETILTTKIQNYNLLRQLIPQTILLLKMIISANFPSNRLYFNKTCRFIKDIRHNCQLRLTTSKNLNIKFNIRRQLIWLKLYRQQLSITGKVALIRTRVLYKILQMGKYTWIKLLSMVDRAYRLMVSIKASLLVTSIH